MRLKGRYINDRKLTNIPGGIRAIDQGDGICEIKKEIDAICMLPRQTPEQQANHDRGIVWSVIGAGFTAGASVTGLFYFPLIAGAVLIASLAWLGVVAWANRA